MPETRTPPTGRRALLAGILCVLAVYGIAAAHLFRKLHVPATPPEPAVRIAPAAVAPTAHNRPLPTFTPSPQPRPAPTPTPVPPVVHTVRAAVTSNLREGPGKQHAIAGRVPEGTLLEVAAITSNRRWVRLESGLWIFASLIEPLPDLPVDFSVEAN